MAAILIVDDRAENREFLVTLLGYKGHETIEAFDGAHALELVRTHLPKLVITDVLMPTMDGYEFVRQVRADPKIAATPIIFYTAKYHKWELQVLSQAGGIVMTKPAEPEEILKAVDGILNAPVTETPPALSGDFDREHLRLITDKLASKVDQLEAFLKLGQQLALERDPLKLLEAFTHEARNVLGAQYASVVLVGEDDSAPQYLTSGWGNATSMKSENTDLSKSFISKLLTQTRAIRWSELKVNNQGFEFPAHFPLIDSMLCAPLTTPTRCYGVLYLANKRRAEGFTEDDEQAAGTLAAQSAIAYENVRRQEEIKRRTVELELEVAVRVRTEADLRQRIIEVEEGKQTENRLRKQADDLTESNRAKDEFLAVISHELRTPLTAMLGWIKMLRSGKLDSKLVPNALAVIERNTVAQAKLIEDLLDVSRLMSNKVVAGSQLQVFDVLVDACVESLRPSADAKGVKIIRDGSLNGSCVQGDSDRLQQIVNNLLTNAIKFTPAGGAVSVATNQINDQVRLTIADTGVGIAAEYLPHVFDRFSQADASSTRSFSGLGLGLSIVRNLVEMHGGIVEAESRGINLGSTFSVSLPASKKSAQDSAPTIEPRKSLLLGVDATDLLRGLRILVVEDNLDSREMLTLILGDLGALVAAAIDAHEALRELATFKPNLILSDIGLPDIDGYEFMRKVRALPNSSGGTTPAIALTAYASTKDRDRALGAGFQHCVTKPVEPENLALVIAEVVGARPRS